MLSNSQCRDQLICTDQAQTFVFVTVRFEFELYIYMVRFEFEFFFAGKSTVGRFLIEPPLQIHTAGAAGDTAALIEVHYRGG